MNAQIFHKIKYDLKGHRRSHKFLLILSSTFIYQPIMIKFLLNTNNKKTIFFLLKLSIYIYRVVKKKVYDVI